MGCGSTPRDSHSLESWGVAAPPGYHTFSNGGCEVLSAEALSSFTPEPSFLTLHPFYILSLLPPPPASPPSPAEALGFFPMRYSQVGLDWVGAGYNPADVGRFLATYSAAVASANPTFELRSIHYVPYL